MPQSLVLSRNLKLIPKVGQVHSRAGVSSYRDAFVKCPSRFQGRSSYRESFRLSNRTFAKWTFNSSSMHDSHLQQQRNKTPKHWQAEENSDIQRVTKLAIIHQLTKQQTQTIETVVPWFLMNMPASYFKQVGEEARLDHLRAIAAVRDANMEMHMNLKTALPDGRKVFTYIRPHSDKGILLSLLNELPWDHNNEKHLPLSRVQSFAAEDDSLSLSVFTYGYEKLETIDVESCGRHILEYAKKVLDGEIENSDDLDRNLLERDSLIEYMNKCGEFYISKSNPHRFLQQRSMFEDISGTENVSVALSQATGIEEFGNCFWFDISTANSLPQFVLEHATKLLHFNHFEVLRSHLDVVSDGKNGTVTHLRIVTRPFSDDVDVSEESIARIIRQSKRMKWLDPFTMELALERYSHLLTLRTAEIITAFASLMHPIMAKENPVIYSKGNILEYLSNKRYISHAIAVANLFLRRFDPEQPLSNNDLFEELDKISQSIKEEVEDLYATALLCKMLDIVKYTLKTNIYMNDRYALSLRLDPEIMFSNHDDRERPFGMIFVHGRRFNGYHVRFRDIARGGLRLVTPSSAEQYALESSRQFDECYGLAYAQQLKNKDIPEGGSKGVCLIDSSEMDGAGKQFVMRKAVKAMADSILDLIVETDETMKNVVDFYGKSEVLYLGPDEQVIPQDIDWIVLRAAQRGYSTPPAFMSSKPRAGINHKEYGVTSEGVNVFLDSALRHTLQINPKSESFTIKITGGPDGDVAGNELLILHREYGSNAKVIGIADHSGCAEDPEGLDWPELLRLVEEQLSINNFDVSKLSSNGNLFLVDNEDGLKKRNTMHNRLIADAFVPAGGRPNTINIGNYKQFLLEDGTPSSKLIVEGANLFITPDARQALYDDAGVIIVKDSSANKCGVICSSYEIAAAMLLSEEEFFENKEMIVADVLVKLRQLALLEAEVLFREFANYHGSLPMMSENVSKCINTTKDAIINALDNLSEDDKKDFIPLVKAHLPKSLVDLSFDRLHEKVPEQYVKNAMASSLASTLVYNEGTKFVESQPVERLATLALQYLHNEKEVALLAEALENSTVSEREKQRILRIFKAGGARTALFLKD